MRAAMQLLYPLLLSGFALQLSACRTGSDGDPWAHLYADNEATDDDAATNPPAVDDTATDDTAEDDDAPEPSGGAPSVGDDDSAGGDDLADDDLMVEPALDDDVANQGDDDSTGADDDVAAPADDDLSDDDTIGTADDDTPTGMDDDDVSDDDIPEPECISSLELCDTIDNDCDAAIDEGFVCPPEPGVVGAVPFEGGLYFEGTTLPGLASATALQRFWPSLEEGYIDGFDTYDDTFYIRRSDHQLFFTNRQELFGSVEGILPITPCELAPYSFDFDAANALFYNCGFGLFREGVELSTASVQLLGVTDDGRAVGRLEQGGPGYWMGNEFVPADIDLGRSVTRYLHATVQGNIAIVPLQLGDSEILVLKFDEQSQWSVLRRQPVVADELGNHIVAISDGTIFMAQWDPNDAGYLRILAYLPDGSEVVAWHEAEANVVTEVNAFLTGPLDPAEILR